MGAAGAALPVRYGFIVDFVTGTRKKTHILSLGSSSVSQREDSPAFSSQFDGMHTLPLSTVLFPTLVLAVVSPGGKKNIGYCVKQLPRNDDGGLEDNLGEPAVNPGNKGSLRVLGDIVLISFYRG